MISYLHTFSKSFSMMLLLWPFVAVLLTFPLLLVQYVKYHRLPLRRVFLNYLFMLYAIGVFFAFTLYPLPQDFAAFCHNRHGHLIEYIPFHSVFDILKVGKKAVFQVLMNVVFFVPLGIFLKSIYGVKTKICLPVLFLSSLLIETMQLTHLFYLFPCQYRVFDVDDIMTNVSGGVLGIFIASFLPDFSRTTKLYQNSLNKKPGPIERSVIILTEFLLIYLLSLAVSVLVGIVFFNSQPEKVGVFNNIFAFGLLVIAQLIIPWFNKGRTPISVFTHSTIDNKERNLKRKTVYYLIRFIVIAFIFMNNDSSSLLICLVLAITYPIKRIPIYSWI